MCGNTKTKGSNASISRIFTMIVVMVGILLMAAQVSMAAEMLKSEKNWMEIARMMDGSSSGNSLRRSMMSSSTLKLEGKRRKITLDDVKSLKRDGFLNLAAFKSNPFLVDSSSWLHDLNTINRNNNQHVIVTLKKDAKLDSQIISTMIGQQSFTANVDMTQLESLLVDENVEKVEYFDPIYKFVVSQFSQKDNSKKLDIDMNGNVKDTFETSTPSKKDWRLTFQDKNGDEFIILRILAEELTNERDLSGLERVLNNIKSTSGGAVSAIKRSGSKKFMMSVKKSQALALTYEISKLSNIFWVEPTPRNEVHNHWAKGITQSGSPFVEPVASRGITGKGQIVTVGDSGLDPNSCFFYDPNHACPYTNETTNLKVSNHRKIASYWSAIDDVSEDNAHGTHVSGTVVSQSIVSSLSEHDGIAHDAKVAFTDIGCSDPKGCTCKGTPKGCPCDLMGGVCGPNDNAIYPPNSMSEDYFPFAYNLGSRVHTNSWGESTGILGYSADSADIDKFIWEHKDFLILFSAGNSGSASGYSSISTQADSKNVIAVGASMNPLSSFKYVTDSLLDMDAYAVRYSQQLMGNLGCPAINVTASDTCDRIAQSRIEVCDFLRNFKTENDCCSTVGQYCSSTNNDCGCSFFGLGSQCCKKCRAARYDTSLAKLVYNSENIAYFSSRGPSSDGRIKPDIVAPGYFIVSARSHNTLTSPMTCAEASTSVAKSVTQMGGTSMSCPLTAANALLVRQYYAEGWHATGKNDSSQGFSPSAALMKATLINSGVPLLGYLDFSGNYIPIHDTSDDTFFKLQSKFLEGFGRIQLDRVLMFDNSTRKLLVGRKDNIKTSSKITTEFGDPIISSTEDSHLYCVAPKSSGKMTDVKITLVWTDYPSNPARSKHLINNLDLGVKIDQDIYFGNAQEKNTFERDNTNNVEQVSISSTGSRIVVNVAASYIFKAQSYALLITGENVKFDECTSSDYFEYSATAKTFSSSLGTGIKIFGFDLALVMVFIVLVLVIIAVAAIAACVFSFFVWKKQSQPQQFARLEDENTREL